MPPSTLTSDEWLTLQCAPLWISISSHPDPNHYKRFYNREDNVLSIAMTLLSYAEKNSKGQVIFEILFAMRTNSGAVVKKLVADSRMPIAVLRDIYFLLKTKLPKKDSDAIVEVYDWYLKSQMFDPNATRLVALANKLSSSSVFKPPSALTSDEWLALHYAPIWMNTVLNKNAKSLYHNTSAFISLAMVLLEFAEKTSKEQIVFELLFGMQVNCERVVAKFQADNRAPEKALQETFSVLNTKLSSKDADAIREIYDWYLKNQIGDPNAVSLVTLADKMATPRSSTTPPLPPAVAKSGAKTPSPSISKHLPVYLLIDSSRHISDSATFLDSGINNRLESPLRSRPAKGIPLKLGFIAINDVSDLAIPLTEPATFHASSLVGAGACQFGRALLSLHVDLANQLSDSKPLVFIFLAGAPNDSWQKPAKQIQDLAKAGKINVIAIGSGALADLACLKEVGAAQPMVMSGITQSNMDQVFDWLYGIIDVIMSGLESGASGAKSAPTPPACLKLIP